MSASSRCVRGAPRQANLDNAVRLIEEAKCGRRRLRADAGNDQHLDDNAGADVAATVPKKTTMPALAAFRDLGAQTWYLSCTSARSPSRVSPDHAANRSYLIGPQGEIVAGYDKIHMFDVDLAGGESYRKSRSYRPVKRRW